MAAVNDVERLIDWLDILEDPSRRTIYKRLSANDTGARTNQAGLYVPNAYAFLIAPELDADVPRPRRRISFVLRSHDQASEPSLIHYNTYRSSKHECHMTGFGGRRSALQDPESTAAILVMSFAPDGRSAEGWLATTIEEEQVIEGELGTIGSGTVGYRGPDETGQLALLETAPVAGTCRPRIDELPPAWAARFPRAADIAQEAVRRIAMVGPDVDRVFMKRRDCEYEIFRVVERANVTPLLRAPFQTVEDFLVVAQSVLQRRKSRAGRSLELQLEQIFREQGVPFSGQATTEDGHRPDFVFPSVDRYHEAPPGARDLAILAAKSTLRERWRQVLREADKVPVKHLFTLDAGLSERQVRAILAEGLVIVTPRSLARHYPAAVRQALMTLQQFVAIRRQEVDP